ncbi:hypothetical protein EC970010_2306, partial [Escherichia coli 97.0010]
MIISSRNVAIHLSPGKKNLPQQVFIIIYDIAARLSASSSA